MLDEQTAAPTALSFDNPEAYIPRDRRRALSSGTPMADRVVGAGLFADISGFTPLTEALAAELGAQRGAEVLTAILGTVISAVISELDRFGGDVIYFSGDAITCWLDGDDGRRATACALAMQSAMGRVGSVVTPGGTPITLAMKVAVAVGPARRFVVGVPRVQVIDVLAGRLVDQLAEAEHHAEKGDVVLDASAIDALGALVELGGVRVEEATGRRFGVVRRLTVDVPDAPVDEPGALPESVVRGWLLPSVYERMRTGRGEFLAELRAAYPIFLRFGGIDYDDDDDADEKLDAFVIKAQEILDGYGGNVLQLTLGDKGAYLYGVFGSPLAHEDDAARAAAAALELRDLESSTAATDIQIGITHGRLRSGTYGHPMRRTFVCLGDAVNLSARLMSAAPAGQIYVSRTVHDDAGDAFAWEALPAMRVKGKSEPVEVFALTGAVARMSRRQIRYELPLVGRRAEMGVLDSRLDEARLGHGQVVGIAAEAGMGKSRLVAEFVRFARRAGLQVAFGECQAFGTTAAYLPWQEVWRTLLGVDDLLGPSDQRAAVEARLRAIDPGLVERAPLLETIIGVTIPDNELTSTFDPKLRKASLEDLLAQCLIVRAGQPLVIVIEDCHWIDELSKSLLEALVRAAPTLPILFVLAYRPAASVGGGLGLERLPQFLELGLAQLDADETRELIRSKLGQLTGTDDEAAPAPEALVSLIAGRAEGNPFYVEEFLNYLVGRGIDPTDETVVAGLDLPNSLQSLILSRIDRLDEAPRRTLKVASVVGRVFQAPVLPRVYPEMGSMEEVAGQLDELRGHDLIALDRDVDQAWLFRHVLMQAVAYQSMPFELRAMLHQRVGEDIEADGPDAIDRQLDLLAHHFWNSRDEAKKVKYLGAAAAAAQAAYANAAATLYFERLLPLLEGRELVEETLRFSQVLHVIGDIPRAEQVVIDAREVAVALDDHRNIARCDHSLADSARRVGRFDDAGELVRRAREAFTSVGDESGVADVLQVAGTLSAQRGDTSNARANYLESLAIRKRLGDEAGEAALTNNLGIVAQQLGDLASARELGERALMLYGHLGDRRRISSCEINLAWMDGMAGRHEDALRHCQEAIRLAQEVGDRLNRAIAENNMGDALRDLGRLDDSGRAYGAAVETYRDLGDLGPLMALFEDIAVLMALRSRDGDAFTLLGASDGLRAAMGSPRPADAEASLLARLSAAGEALGEETAIAARRSGTTLSLEDAIGLALASTSGPRPG